MFKSLAQSHKPKKRHPPSTHTLHKSTQLHHKPAHTVLRPPLNLLIHSHFPPITPPLMPSTPAAKVPVERALTAQQIKKAEKKKILHDAFVPNQGSQNHRKNNTWSLETDLVTVRTGLFLEDKIATKRTSEATQIAPMIGRNQPTTVCNSCLLHNDFCICSSLPPQQDLQHALANIANVIVYFHTSEVFQLNASNTARFLPMHGAYPVLMGDLKGETIMRNIILSRPRDSVFVLFPSKDSITPAEFMQRYNTIGNNHHPYQQYPPQQLNTSSLQQSAEISQAQFHNPFNHLHNLDELLDDNLQFLFPTLYTAFLNRPANFSEKVIQESQNLTNPSLKPLIIVLDGTWSNAKTLDRRLSLIMSSVFQQNEYNEKQFLTEISPDGSLKPIDPKQYLHRVRVTRAMRNDIGQLRRLQGSERTTVTSAGMDFNPVQSLARSTNFDIISKNTQNFVNTTNNDFSINGTSTETLNTQNIPENIKELIENGDKTITHSPSSPTKMTDKKTKMMLTDDDALDDESGGKVNTLHAFLVMLEEMYNLPMISSHNKLLDEDGMYLSSITNKINQEDENKMGQNGGDIQRKLSILNIVKNFTTILSAVIIGYHTQQGLLKAQLLDATTRQVVKEKYALYLEKKDEQKKNTLERKKQQRTAREQLENTITTTLEQNEQSDHKTPPKKAKNKNDLENDQFVQL